MRSTEQEHLLPLWESEDGTSSPAKSEEANLTTPMILVSIPEALHSSLRALVRCDRVTDRTDLFSREAAHDLFGEVSSHPLSLTGMTWRAMQ